MEHSRIDTFRTSSVGTCHQLDNPLRPAAPFTNLWSLDAHIWLRHPQCALASSTSFRIMAYGCSGHLLNIMRIDSYLTHTLAYAVHAC